MQKDTWKLIRKKKSHTFQVNYKIGEIWQLWQMHEFLNQHYAYKKSTVTKV